MVVEFTTRPREAVDYAVILTIEDAGGSKAVRSYDRTHGSTR
jgi:hypothetical protein